MIFYSLELTDLKQFWLVINTFNSIGTLTDLARVINQFWQVLVFFGSFFIIKTSQERGRILWNPWQSKLKLKHMKNPSFGEPRSLYQANQVCKEENQRRNLATNNFAWLCKIFTKHAKCQKEYKLQDREQICERWILHPVRNFTSLVKFLLFNFQIFLHRLR